MEKQTKKKLILWGIGIVAAGAAGYFGWKYFRSLWQGSDAIPQLPSPPPADSFKPTQQPGRPVSKSPASKPKPSDFPLKKGSKGEKVKAVQEGLINRFGKAILPKYGADGDFGTEMTNALKSKGYPPTIDEALYNVLTSGTESNSDIAKALVSAAVAKNFNLCLAQLKKIKSPEQYAAVSTIFKQSDTIGSTRYTLVTGMLRLFPSGAQNLLIRDEFYRMGLKHDDKTDTWSVPKSSELSGLARRVIMSARPTVVWKDTKTAIKVPKGLALGMQVERKGIHTLFENQSQYYLVPTKDIQYF